MIYLDRKYLLLLSTSLPYFKQKDQDTYNFRCPFCHDSQKNKLKARGYIYCRSNTYFYWCHNCNYSTNMIGLLKLLDPILYNQYLKEKFSNPIQPNTISSLEKVIPPSFTDIKIQLESIANLPPTHWVRDYVESRKIPLIFHSDLYFSPDFFAFVGVITTKNYCEQIIKDPRLVIPFRDQSKKLIGFQGRTLNGSDPKYLTFKLDESYPKIYGLDRVDIAKKCFVVEGPIDSMFLDNAIATTDINLTKASQYLEKDQLVLVFDREYRNEQVVDQIYRAIDENFTVCLLPKHLPGKDINDFVMQGIPIETIHTILFQNMYKGLRARLELSKLL